MHNLQLITVDDNTCITANGKPVTNVGTDNICRVMIIHFAQKNFGPHMIINNRSVWLCMVVYHMTTNFGEKLPYSLKFSRTKIFVDFVVLKHP